MKLLIGFIAWIIIFLGGAAPVPNSSVKVNFIVPQGQSASQIVQSLFSEKLIKSQTTAKIYLKLTGFDQRITIVNKIEFVMTDAGGYSI